MPLRNVASPILCYVTDRGGLAPGGLQAVAQGHAGPLPPEIAQLGDAFTPLLSSIAAAAADGVQWIQLREKDLAAKELARLTRAALSCCAAIKAAAASSSFSSPRILVNDRLDVAIAERAAGVHLGENSLPVGDAKRLLRNISDKDHAPALLAGVSCHSLGAAQAAATAGADYIFFGPIFPTPSKRTYGAAQGLQRLAEVCRAVRIPVLAIGGINAENAADCVAAGAAGIAAIRLFQEAKERATIPDLLRSLKAG